MLAVLVLAAAACGGGAAPAAAPERPLPLLDAAAVPGLSGERRDLTAVELAQDAGARELGNLLEGWGFVRASERDMRGGTGDIAVLVTRTVEFEGPTGAHRYADFLRRKATLTLGSAPDFRPLEGGGYLFEGSLCGCHRETPQYLVVRPRGARVSWLRLNGPGVDEAIARRLARQMP